MALAKIARSLDLNLFEYSEIPVANGFIAQILLISLENFQASEAVIKVFPMPVSVPVTKKPSAKLLDHHIKSDYIVC